MEKLYLHYDEITGNFKGFYSDQLHDVIPTPNIEITKEKHNFYLNNNGLYKLNPTTLEDELIDFSGVVNPKTDVQVLQETVDALLIQLLGGE